MKPAAYWIEKLGLESHVEGGAFKEVSALRYYCKTYRLPSKGRATQVPLFTFYCKTDSFQLFTA